MPVDHYLRLGVGLIAGSLHAIIYFFLLLAFLRSLQAGKTPLITRLALSIRQDLPPEMIGYTRRVTMAWTVFFALQLIASLLIYLFLPETWWLIFIGALNMPLLVLMFLSELAVRHWCFPGYRHDSWQDMRQIPARLRGLLMSSR